MYKIPTLRALMGVVVISGLASLAACGDSPPPPQTSSTTKKKTTTAPPPAPVMVPGAPGTVTTQTTHSQTMP
jgi:hypothetical protein